MAELLTGTVTGRFQDTVPGAENITGTVYFAAEADYLLSDDSIVLPSPVSVQLVDSEFSVDLVATDNAALNPVDWSYRVTFDLRVNGRAVKYAEYSIEVPAGVVTDLSTVTPVASTDGSGMIVGPVGPVGPKGDKGDTGDNAPFTSLSILGTTTGPETPGATGPQGPIGPKGDPGGITMGTLIGAGDLNNFVTSGVYRQENGANILLSKNYPENSGETGILIVHQTSGTTFLEQQWYPSDAIRNSRVFWTRSYNYGVWRPWRAYASTRVDQTAGRAIYTWDPINNRDQLVWGDTGSRELKALSPYPVPAWGVCRLRRQGGTVTLTIQGMDTSPLAGQNVLDLPAGFVPNMDVRFNLVTEGGFQSVRFLAAANGALTIANREANGAAGASYLYTSGVVTWETNQAWPTTLPGTAVGSIPNA